MTHIGRLLLFILLFLSCSHYQPANQPQFPNEQRAEAYLVTNDLDRLQIPMRQQNQLDSVYNRHVFSPWHSDTLCHSPESLWWPLTFTQRTQGYGENKLAHTEQWLESLIKNADSTHTGQRVWDGISLERTNLRALPTHRPWFLDFNKAGEGYPFDYFQNSALPMNTPCRVIHQSRDRAWLLIETHHTAGWVPFRHIGRIDSFQQTLWTSAPLVSPIQDGVTLEDTLGRFLAKVHIGALFPLVDTTGTHFIVRAAIDEGQGGCRLSQARILRSQAVIKPWPFTLKRAALLANQLARQPYGWGGLFQNRDCSAMIKDFYTPFGIWLPRNSRAQANACPVQIDLTGMPPQEKKKRITQQGIPYLSLLYKPGHIMLYAGELEGEPIIFHNVWGLKTRSFWGREGRHLIGQSVFSTLTPGRDLKVKGRRGSLLESVTKLTTIVEQGHFQ